jgi:hypothetical protein
MLSLCVVLSVEGLNPAPLSAAGALNASWNANTEPDLAGYKIYYGLSSGNYTFSINVGKVTQYTVSQLTEGLVYYFAVTAYDTAGNESAYSPEVSAQIPVVDRTPPAVNSVKLLDPSTVEIKFSEAVTPASAQNLANYVIDNGIVVSNATLQADSLTVKLATSAHATGKTYKIIIQKIADRALVPNVMSQAVSFNYFIPAVDRTPPAVTSFRAVDQQNLEIVFDEALSLATAQNTANFTITPAVTVQNAKLQADNRTVTLSTAPHTTGVNYTLTIRGIADRAPAPNVMAQAASYNYSFKSTDTVPPAVSNVRFINPTTVEVLFSEPVAGVSAQTEGNYLINKGIVVNNATLLADTRAVTLTTSTHTAGETYTLTVRNVADRATPANIMAQAQTFTYTYEVEDRRPPEVNAVTLTDQTHLLIVFNELVTVASAQNAGNYSISDGIQILEARLAGNGLEVTLLTSAHLYNKDYNVTVRNIKDRSAAANTIAAGTIFTYFLANNSGNNNSGLSVNSLKPARYVVDSLQVGSAYYIDRPYVIRQIPNSKRGLLWIRTASADRNDTGEPFIEFTLTRESNLYVAYDSRAQQPPNWLMNYFAPTNEFITVSENNVKLNLWKQRRIPGSVVLGGNMAGGVRATTSLSMYVVLIEDVQAPPATNSSTPQSFVLFPNYPNPFSASGRVGGTAQTNIRFYLQEPHQVVLTVHNKLGQVVRQLNSGLMPAGYHNLSWDGRDDGGQPLPSGNYLCTLEVRDEVASAGLAMSASLNRQTRVITLLK